VLYELCCMLLLPHEQTGLLQLGRLMLTARFSYFNLSTGALLGVFFGMVLRQRRGEPSQVKSLALWGSALLSVGFSIYSLQRHRYPMGFSSPDINVPEWLFYVGATLLLGAAFERILLVTTRPLLRQGLQWLGVVGQCAMPIFILQGVALDVSAFGRALGLRDALAVLVSLGSFTLVVGYLMWRIHGLYYGALAEKTPSGVEVARVAT
jgi:hypothetical protein